MDISALIRQCQAGNSDAFGQIYDLYADRIFRFIRLKIQEPRQAEDLLQDVFVKAWQGLPKLPLEKLNFQAWLYKVANNTINDHFRKTYRTPIMTELTTDLPIAASDSPAKTTAAIVDAAVLKQALEGLPKTYQQVLELRFIQDFSVAETAGILGKTNLAVRLLQHRALKQLKLIMENTHAYET